MYERISDLYIREARTHIPTHTHTHTNMHTLSYKKHLCPTLLTLSASFPERHIKGCVHSSALCSLKCSRAATDPQILTFKPSGGKREQQQRERDGDGEVKWTDRQRQTKGSAFVVVQVGVVRFVTVGLNLLWLNVCLPAVNVCREERVYWCGGGSTQR